ncbi:MAG: putative acyl esterase [Myxococcota bacterium]|jgi:predicted acyl esterase
MLEQPQRVTMNDGVVLDVSVHRPDGAAPEGGFPAVLLVHGHGENGSKAMTAERAGRLVGQGYLAVCYSVRGQGGSEGLSFHLGAREIYDLQDMIDWTLALPGVGKLAVCGSSQGGWHSWMAAIHHPGVTCVVPENIFVDYADFAVPTGSLSTWFFTRTMRRRVMSAGLQDMARQWAISGEWQRIRTWTAPSSPRHFVGRIRCPVLVIHGWHDVGMPANNLLSMMEGLTAPWMLYLGGGGHDGQDAENAATFRQDLVDRWLAHWLKGEDTGLLAEPRIHYARRPAWDHLAADRLVGDREETHYLCVDGTLTDAAPTTATANTNLNNLTRDPSYDLSRAIHTDMAGVLDAWPREEQGFTSPPAPEARDLLGIPRLILHTLPATADYQIHAELLDVAPDGTASLISRGHAGSQTAAAGQHLRLDIALRAIAYRLPAGHRLRVVLTNTNPAYVVPRCVPWRARIYHEVERESRLVLPVSG